MEKAGVVGLIEPINPYWVPHYFLNDFDIAQDIITEINHPNIRLMLDIFHLQYQDFWFSEKLENKINSYAHEKNKILIIIFFSSENHIP